MNVIQLDTCPLFTAGDGTELREMLHPDKSEVALRYSLAHATLPAGHRSLKHRLRTSEVYYILSGSGIMHINAEESRVNPSDTIYIPPHATQWIENDGDEPLLFLCIVDPAWQKEDEVILE